MIEKYYLNQSRIIATAKHFSPVLPVHAGEENRKWKISGKTFCQQNKKGFWRDLDSILVLTEGKGGGMIWRGEKNQYIISVQFEQI